MADAFVKRGPVGPGYFEAEAAGLRWLSAVPRGARAARVYEVTADRIELEPVAGARPTREAAAEFGAALSRTHDAGARAFGSPPQGWDGPGYIGRRRQEYADLDSWGAFYAAHRVLPFLEPALAAGNLTEQEAETVREACRRIAAGDFDDGDPPARLHGDLWAGNVLFSPSGVVMIDPAAHGGHRETDLAMLQLFGAPHLDEILTGYQEQHPLRDGWRERVPLHQLHPLAVHAAGHGRAYGIELSAAARATLAIG